MNNSLAGFRLSIAQPLEIYVRQSEKILGLTSRKTGNILVVSVEKLERRVALLENGRLEDTAVERSARARSIGSVYKGRVKNIEMGLKAMFVDIGSTKMRFSILGRASGRARQRNEEVDRPSKETTHANHKRKISEHLSGRLGGHRSGHKGRSEQRSAGDDQFEFCRALPLLMPFSDRSDSRRSKIRKSAPSPENFARARYPGRDRRHYSPQ